MAEKRGLCRRWLLRLRLLLPKRKQQQRQCVDCGQPFRPRPFPWFEYVLFFAVVLFVVVVALFLWLTLTVVGWVVRLWQKLFG